LYLFRGLVIWERGVREIMNGRSFLWLETNLIHQEKERKLHIWEGIVYDHRLKW
jgi:hypothetical protein